MEEEETLLGLMVPLLPPKTAATGQTSTIVGSSVRILAGMWVPHTPQPPDLALPCPVNQAPSLFCV